MKKKKKIQNMIPITKNLNQSIINQKKKIKKKKN